MAAPGQRQRDPEGQVSQGPPPWLGPNSVLWKDHPHPVFSVAASEKGSAGSLPPAHMGVASGAKLRAPSLAVWFPPKPREDCAHHYVLMELSRRSISLLSNHSVCLCLSLPKLNLWSSSDPELAGPRDTAPDLASGRSFVYRSGEAVMGHCCLRHGQVESLPFAASSSGLVQSHRPLVFHPPASVGRWSSRTHLFLSWHTLWASFASVPPKAPGQVVVGSVLRGLAGVGVPNIQHLCNVSLHLSALQSLCPWPHT